MDYQITYHPEQNRKFPLGRPKTRRGRLRAALVAAILVSLLLHPLCRERIREFCREVRETYRVEILRDELRSGATVGEAFTAFCLYALRQGNVV